MWVCSCASYNKGRLHLEDFGRNDAQAPPSFEAQRSSLKGINITDFSNQRIMAAVTIYEILTMSQALHLALYMLKRHDLDLQDWKK